MNRKSRLAWHDTRRALKGGNVGKKEKRGEKLPDPKQTSNTSQQAHGQKRSRQAILCRLSDEHEEGSCRQGGEGLSHQCGAGLSRRMASENACSNARNGARQFLASAGIGKVIPWIKGWGEKGGGFILSRGQNTHLRECPTDGGGD